MSADPTEHSTEHLSVKKLPRNQQELSSHAVDALQQPLKDHWTSSAYNVSASFVPHLTQEIGQWLDPHPADAILDLGCGDGLLTAKVAERCTHVTGLDASPNFIQAAVSSYGSRPNIDWQVLDCRHLEGCGAIREGHFDKVFSNAALHWILRDPSTRMSVFRGVYKALKRDGNFVFEMGGIGNVAEVHTALLAALVHRGISIEKARETCPWFFPSEQLMKDMLKEVGFQVLRSKLEYRPTKLTTKKEGGLPGWVRLMGAQFLEVLDTDEKKDAVVNEVCDVLKTVLTHKEDDSVWLGYVRLKVIARK